MRRTIVLAVAVLSSLAAQTVTSSASADAPSSGIQAAPAAGCFVSTVANGTSLPSNAPAIFVNDQSAGATATISAELVTGTERVAFVGPTKDTHGLAVLSFASPTAGAHTIATKVVCSNGQETRITETPITLTAPVAFPTSVGSLAVRSTGTGSDRIILTASPELKAFFPVSKLRISVDTGATSKPQGAYVPSGGANPEFNAQTGAVCVENGALHREKRSVKIVVSADIAGVAESPAPATLDVTVDCGAIRWTSLGDDTTTNLPNPDTGGTTPTSDASAGTGGTDGGCSAAPLRAGGAGGFGSVGVAAVVAGAVVLAGLRRRRGATGG